MLVHGGIRASFDSQSITACRILRFMRARVRMIGFERDRKVRVEGEVVRFIKTNLTGGKDFELFLCDK